MAEHVCPVWVGYLLSSPVRKLYENPKKILSPYVKEGMTVMDAGCAMGFFSLPMAEMVGTEGRVICIDLQEKMVTKLFKKAKKKNLNGRIEVRVCKKESLRADDLAGSVDFVLAAAVVHEVPDSKSFFTQLCETLKDGGKLLVVEPSGHVTGDSFRHTIEIAESSGFTVISRPNGKRKYTVLFEKTS